jgi:hypothetical protein
MRVTIVAGKRFVDLISLDTIVRHRMGGTTQLPPIQSYAFGLSAGDTCPAKVFKSCTAVMQKYFHINVDKLVDGLDDGYSDYRRRNMDKRNAVFVVLCCITGVSQDGLNKIMD